MAGVNTPDGLTYSVDWLICRDGYLSAWGWAVHRDAAVSAVRLLFVTPSTTTPVEIRYGVGRGDAPENSGFVVFGRAPRETVTGAVLEATLTTGAVHRIELDLAAVSGAAGHPPHVLRRLGPPGLAARVRLRWAWARTLLEHVWRQGRHRWMRMRGRNLPRFRAPERGVTPLTLDRILDLLGPNPARPLSLMIDSNLGGGTTHYREQWIQREVNAGGTVILFSYDFHRLRYAVRAVTRGRDKSFATDSLHPLVMLAAALPGDDLFLNSVCSFPDPLLVVSLSRQLRRLMRSTLTVAIHDFLCVCPSWNLLNDRGRFCGVPDRTECRRCLPLIGGEVRSLVACSDIDRWRTVWGECLADATTILCFSRSSRDLVERAYPDLRPDAWVIQPHAPSPLSPTARAPAPLDRPLHIGVVGEITRQKGAAIVLEMTRLIRDRGLPVQLTVIGHLEGARPSPLLHVLGPYAREQLPTLVAECGANVFFLPSIWPETFSYVAEELMQLGVPVAVFDMGAPAERVARYDPGLLIDRVDAAHALEQLIAFHARLGAARQSR